MKGVGEWRGVLAILAPARKRKKKENLHREPVVYFGDTLPKKSKVSLKPHHPFPTPTFPVSSLPPVSSSSAHPPLTSPIVVYQRPFNAPTSSCSTRTVAPPSADLHHTAHSVSSSSYLLPYPILISSSAPYLSDPLNGYSKMGMPKNGVRLVSGQWNVAVDPKGVQEGSAFGEGGRRQRKKQRQ